MRGKGRRGGAVWHAGAELRSLVVLTKIYYVSFLFFFHHFENLHCFNQCLWSWSYQLYIATHLIKWKISQLLCFCKCEQMVFISFSPFFRDLSEGIIFQGKWPQSTFPPSQLDVSWKIKGVVSWKNMKTHWELCQSINISHYCFISKVINTLVCGQKRSAMHKNIYMSRWAYTTLCTFYMSRWAYRTSCTFNSMSIGCMSIWAIEWRGKRRKTILESILPSRQADSKRRTEGGGR